MQVTETANASDRNVRPIPDIDTDKDTDIDTDKVSDVPPEAVLLPPGTVLLCLSPVYYSGFRLAQ